MADRQDVIVNYQVQGADDVTKKTNGLTNALGKLTSLLKTGVMAAFAGLATAVGLGIKEIADGEKATAKLNQALVNTGKYTKETSKALQEYANSMQKKVAFDDESIIAAEASFAAYGLEQRQIEELTKVTADLATAKGLDLASAADLVAKSVGSSTNAMARYGISIEGAAGSNERIQAALKGLDGLYGGQAEAFGKTLPGQMAIFKNEAMNLAGTFTSFLMPAFQKGIEIANGLLKSLSGIVESSGFKAFMQEIGRAISLAWGYLQPFWESLKQGASNILPYVISTFQSLWDSLKNIFTILNNLGVGGIIKGAFDIFLKGAQAVWVVIEKLAKAIEWMVSGLAKLTGKKVTVETENKQTNQVSGESGQGTNLESISTEEDAKTELMLQKSEERKALLDEQKLAMRGMDQETKAEWDAIDNEEELLKFEEKLAKLNENNELTLQQEQMFEERRKQMKAANYQQDFMTWLGVEKLKLVNKQSTAQQMDNWENFMLQGQKSKNKQVAEMAKALAIKNIIFQTGQAAMSAYSSMAAIPFVGPVLGAIAAAAAIAFGAEQISTVQSQTTELAEGGSMIVDQPTQIGGNVIAGEAGPERIDVTPLDQQQPQTIVNNIILDGEVIATQVAKINQQSRTEGTLDDNL